MPRKRTLTMRWDARRSKTPRRVRAEETSSQAADQMEVSRPQQRLRSLDYSKCETHKIARKLQNGTEVAIHFAGSMTVYCMYCRAKLFPGEVRNGSSAMCCHNGKVSLPSIECPSLLKHLLQGNESPNFLENIRQYNNALAFASVKVNMANFASRGPYCFKIHGQIYHIVRSLLPAEDSQPSYAGLYFIDSREALQHRMSRKENDSCEASVMERLQNMLQVLNPYAQLFSFVKNMSLDIQDKQLLFSTNNAFDRRRYNLPTGDEIAAAFVTDDGAPPGKMDFAIHVRSSDQFISVSSLNPHCDPMCYPLLFPCGDRGWKPGMNHVDIYSTRVNNSITQLQYYCYRLAVRDGFNLLHASGKLFQQYIVDAYVKVEGSRIAYIKSHQKELRAESYKGLTDFLHSNAQLRGMSAGIPVILPSSFIGSPRNMLQNYQDAMSIVARFGKPDIFLTFTANPRWKEIHNSLNSHEKIENRPDLISRVFYLKLKELLADLHDRHVLGVVTAYVDVIEFQKRGLPHAHMLLIFRSEDKVREPVDVDSIVSAEIPDATENLELHNIIKRCMVHGPCGEINPNAPCMEDGKCTKKFPKSFCEETKMNVDGYPLYRRRNNGRTFNLRNVEINNRWIVPYNPYLTLKFEAHINVEICSSVKSVKYIYKYIYKGHDAAALQIQNGTLDQGTLHVNEPNIYLNVRYVSPPEALWRLHERHMQNKSHTIERLPVHLPQEEMIYFIAGQETEAVERALSSKTKLTAFFELCKSDEHARRYIYSEIPEHYVWKRTEWARRKRITRCIGRMFTVNPLDRERYYLRLLLLHVRGPQSFEDMRTVNGTLLPTFHSAAQKLKLLDFDEEWFQCLSEAQAHQMPKQLRQLFAIICVFCMPDSPYQLWESFKECLSEDYARTYDKDLSLDMALCDIERFLKEHGSCCKKLGLPEPTSTYGEKSKLPSFNSSEEKKRGLQAIGMLNQEQKGILLEILDSVESNKGKQFFIDGPGGTGKTFVYKTLCWILRGENKIVLPVAWTGIAANLIEGGRTAHSLFKFPVPIVETSVSNIRQNSDDAKIIRESSLIIWDEVSMVPKEALGVLHKLLKDLTGSDCVFGGKTIVFGGDFRQVLPVVRNGSRSDVVQSCVKHSPLWKYVHRRKLTQNMRANDDPQFCEWLLKLGNGELTADNPVNLHSVNIPLQCFCEKNDLIKQVFTTTIINGSNIKDFTDKAILCPKNEDCSEINEQILEKFIEGETKTYYSSDSVVCDHGQDQQLYPVEFLNTLNPSGLPPHNLHLKPNAIVMLVRNLNPKKGLVNGAKLIVKILNENSITAELIGASTLVILPRIVLTPSDPTMPFQLRRKQFPIKLAFAMTINKAQGQTLSKVGIFLRDPVFSHGQLYVAFSRGKKFEDVKLCISDSSEQKVRNNSIVTNNVVYKEVL